MGSDPHLVAGWLVDELLVTALHGDVPHVVPDVLRLHPTQGKPHGTGASAREIRIGRERGKGEGEQRYPAVRGPVDVVLGVAHDAEKSADDAQRQHGLQPVEPHREPDGETADGDGDGEISDPSRSASYPSRLRNWGEQAVQGLVWVENIGPD